MIVSISNFNKSSYLSSISKNYFKRSINSQFFWHESIGLFNNHSCYSLPCVFQTYGGVCIEITVHPSLFNEEDIPTNSHPLLKDFKINIKVPFLYIIDVIINDSINKLKKFLKKSLEKEQNIIKNSLKQQEEEYDILTPSKSKSNNKESPIKPKYDNKDKINYKEISQQAKFEEMLKIIEENLKPTSDYRYVFKLKSYEEFLFGEYSIGSYECIRKYVREFESVKLILFKKPLHETNPPLDHFPPIIFIEKNIKFTFLDLFHTYMSNYPRNCALFRFGDTEQSQRQQFLKKKESNRDKLVKYTESGECDYPFHLTIIRIINLKGLRNWLENEEYMKNEIMLPNFTEFQTKEEFEEKKMTNKVKKLFCCSNKKSKGKQLPSSFHNTMPIISQFNSNNETRSLKQNNKDLIQDKIEKEERMKRKKQMNKIKKSKKENDKYDIELNSMGVLKKQLESKMDKMTNKLKIKTFEDKIEKKIKNSQLFFEPQSNINNSSEANSKYHFSFDPIFILVKVDLLYGSYKITTYETHFFLLNENLICLNETIIFTHPEYRFLISHLPRETRFGFTIVGYNKNQNESIELGSCQIPLYKDNGVMNSGRIKVSIWPYFQIDPKFNCCTSFQFKSSKIISNQTVEDKLINNGELDQQKKIKQLKGKVSNNIPIRKETDTLMDSNESIKIGNQLHQVKENQLNNDKNQEKQRISPYSKYTEEKIDQSQYCYILIDLPSFTKPLAHCPKSPSSYKNFLLEQNLPSNCFDKLYGSMIEDMNSLLSEWEKSGNANDIAMINSQVSKANTVFEEDIKNDNDDLLTKRKIEGNLEHIGSIIKKDPLTKLTAEEREHVLICRDYLSTMPNSIEVFLRSIDWFDPCHVYIAHLYLKRWVKLKPEDAIILLDSRFPDVNARELAIKTLNDVTDDTIELFILQLCQCLQYESYLLNPLADFLIKKSLSNPKLIGNKFYWSAKVGSENYLFRDRLSILITQWFMVSGPHRIESVHKNLRQKEQFKELTQLAKETYANCKDSNKVEVVKASIIEILEQWNSDKNKYNFVLPIHPSYYIGGYTSKEVSVFDSKMVPIKIPCRSSDESVLPVMFKIGDDLRQDELILQILKIMDRMWLENDLDLKISTYNVCPLELKCGFIEFVNARVIEGVQQSKSGGAMDQELLYNHMMQLANKSEQSKTKLLFNNQIDNFIRSLAGYSVATGVLGIADRHPGNVMLKENGIFFHIDYGHILGHFKTKFGIQRERSAFLMTPDMAYVYIKTNNEEKFKCYCVQAYNILRHNAQRLLNLFITMTSAGMPELTGMNEVKYFRDMLSLDKKNDEDAGNYFLTLLKDSKNEKYRLFDNMIHNLKHA